MYSRPDAPVRLALEMRLTGDSGVTLAPQRFNSGGTIAIEVLTTLATPPKVWASFKQEIVDRWTSYTDAKGAPLNVRPHWAKEWSGLKVRGKDIETYLKEDAFKGPIDEFKTTFTKIVTARGGTVDDTLARFGNATMEKVIFGK